MTNTENIVYARAERRAALIGGLALLLMAVLAPIANYAILGNTSALENLTLVRVAALLLLVVAVLDVVVAWALYLVFERADRNLALLAGWLRVTYAAMLALSLGPLLQGSQMVDVFRANWDLGLLVFGLHLLVVAGLILKTKLFPLLVGILVLVAGTGYVFDSVVKLLMPNPFPLVSSYTFVGEVVLIFWLIWKGLRRS